MLGAERRAGIEDMNGFHMQLFGNLQVFQGVFNQDGFGGFAF